MQTNYCKTMICDSLNKSIDKDSDNYNILLNNQWFLSVDGFNNNNSWVVGLTPLPTKRDECLVSDKISNKGNHIYNHSVIFFITAKLWNYLSPVWICISSILSAPYIFVLIIIKMEWL